jgi:hypothetical protein
MAISSQPVVLSESVDAYINAGNTTRLQTITGSTGAINIAITNGAVARMSSLAGNTTVTFTEVPSGYANQWLVEVANRGANTVTFSGVTWDGGSAPTIVASGKTVLRFYSTDGGTTIYGKVEFANIA